MKSTYITCAIRWVLVPLAFACVWSVGLALQVPGPLVDTEWLADNKGAVVILDVRQDASGFSGKSLGPDKKPNLGKLIGHIPDAVSVPWKKIVTKGEEQGVALKGMLPAAKVFTEVMQTSGVGNDSAVVITGQGSNGKDQALATRLYFSLKYFSHDNVALLDGGTAQWAKEGRPLAYTVEKPVRGDFLAGKPREHWIASTESVEKAIKKGDAQLIDCRSEDFYLGVNYKRNLVSPDHKGHLAGAKSLPFIFLIENQAPAKLFPIDEIRKAAALKGVDMTRPTIAYCNTGVLASLEWYVFHELEGNQQTQLYDGSMHAWSRAGSGSRIVALSESSQQEPGDGAKRVAAEVTRQEMLPLQPRPSLQSLIDERRDALERRRERYFDAVSGRRFLQPPSMIMRGDMVDSHQDKMRELHRTHRDTMKAHHDAYRRLYAPWSQGFHDQAEVRHFALQMEQLDREEFFDRLSARHLYGSWGPSGY